MGALGELRHTVCIINGCNCSTEWMVFFSPLIQYGYSI